MVLLVRGGFPVVGAGALYSRYGDRGGRRRLRRDSSEPRPHPAFPPDPPPQVGEGRVGRGGLRRAAGEEEDENHRTERHAALPLRSPSWGTMAAGPRKRPQLHIAAGSAGDAAGAGLQCRRPAIVRPIGGLARQYRVLAPTRSATAMSMLISGARRGDTALRNDAGDVDAHGGRMRSMRRMPKCCRSSTATTKARAPPVCPPRTTANAGNCESRPRWRLDEPVPARFSGLSATAASHPEPKPASARLLAANALMLLKHGDPGVGGLR